MTFSDRGLTLVRSLRSVLHALDECTSQSERQQIYEFLAAHLRSAAPMALLGTSDVLEPVRECRVQLDGGAFIEITRREDGRTTLYAFDQAGHDADLTLDTARAQQLRAGIARVMAGG